MMTTIGDLHKGLPQGASVLDVGCLSFQQWKHSQSIHREDLRHAGVDYSRPDWVPSEFDFRLTDLNRGRIPFEDDRFDLVVACHVIEHLERPVDFFADCVRVCKPGGKLYIECPSERSLMLPGFPFEHDKFYSTSFFDDPTHLGRPFSPQSLVRLAAYHGCVAADVGYDISWVCRLLFPFVLPFALLFRRGWLVEFIVWKSVGWSSYIVVEKPRDLVGVNALKYFVPENRGDDWIRRGLLRIKRLVSSED